jgi:osmotically-inducible protein OsmY
MRYAALTVAVALAFIGCSRRSSELDRGGATRTTGAQTEPSSDYELGDRVRRSIADDATLAYAAKNVTVVANKGVVTLRGQVDDEQESAAVERRARLTPGVERVDNQIDVSK